MRSCLAGRSPVETNVTPATEGGQILPLSPVPRLHSAPNCHLHGLPIPTPLDQPGSTNGIGNGMNRKARSHGLVSPDF